MTELSKLIIACLKISAKMENMTSRLSKLTGKAKLHFKTGFRNSIWLVLLKELWVCWVPYFFLAGWLAPFLFLELVTKEAENRYFACCYWYRLAQFWPWFFHETFTCITFCCLCLGSVPLADFPSDMSTVWSLWEKKTRKRWAQLLTQVSAFAWFMQPFKFSLFRSTRNT